MKDPMHETRAKCSADVMILIIVVTALKKAWDYFQ
jgi:hypothetical protein